MLVSGARGFEITAVESNIALHVGNSTLDAGILLVARQFLGLGQRLGGLFATARLRQGVGQIVECADQIAPLVAASLIILDGILHGADGGAKTSLRELYGAHLEGLGGGTTNVIGFARSVERAENGLNGLIVIAGGDVHVGEGALRLTDVFGIGKLLTHLQGLLQIGEGIVGIALV